LMDTAWQDADFHCITCSDEAVSVRVISVDQATALAQVAVGDSSGEVDVSLIDSVNPGDILLAHGGVALALVSSES
ncbi:MAG: HypC/HybG/HupF family hydrogenase formation chaperone, partial [Chloroflexia bacterium]